MLILFAAYLTIRQVPLCTHLCYIASQSLTPSFIVLFFSPALHCAGSNLSPLLPVPERSCRKKENTAEPWPQIRPLCIGDHIQLWKHFLKLLLFCPSHVCKCNVLRQGVTNVISQRDITWKSRLSGTSALKSYDIFILLEGQKKKKKTLSRMKSPEFCHTLLLPWCSAHEMKTSNCGSKDWVLWRCVKI